MYVHHSVVKSFTHKDVLTRKAILLESVEKDSC